MILTNNEIIEFREYIKNRGIKDLVHFTDGYNIKSIEKLGLMSRFELNKSHIKYKFNDLYRNDKYKDYVCLSVTQPNLSVLNSFMYKGMLNDPWVVYVDPKILYQKEVFSIYSDINAASKTANISTYLGGFKKLFAQRIQRQNGNDIEIIKERTYHLNNMTTDHQAEVLCYKKIDRKYIIGFGKIVRMDPLEIEPIVPSDIVKYSMNEFNKKYYTITCN